MSVILFAVLFRLLFPIAGELVAVGIEPYFPFQLERSR